MHASAKPPVRCPWAGRTVLVQDVLTSFVHSGQRFKMEGQRHHIVTDQQIATCSALQQSWPKEPMLRARHRKGPSGRRALCRGLALALELWRASATLLHSHASRHVVLVTGANRGLGIRGPRNRCPLLVERRSAGAKWVLQSEPRCLAQAWKSRGGSARWATGSC
jgi:hypothetical protein